MTFYIIPQIDIVTVATAAAHVLYLSKVMMMNNNNNDQKVNRPATQGTDYISTRNPLLHDFVGPEAYLGTDTVTKADRL